ncbi:hypothetical protein [uncultured Cardiobacterium sp.]|uniref:hypothetical protein n=1 Tax=uncultured Cardiobacterium sp. TaxID=417619 RepID=UPI00261C1AC7|nr:hypothetical protein [uncultured Cardiobacterium sp.]
MTSHENPDYATWIAQLAQADDDRLPHVLPPEAYQYVVDTLLRKRFEYDYTDETEEALCRRLPELVGQPRVSATCIDPRYLDFLNDPANARYLHDNREYLKMLDYLVWKMDNLDPLTPTEQQLVGKMPELDGERIMTFAVTPAFLHEMAECPEQLTDEQMRCLVLYLDAKVMDRLPLTGDEETLYNLLARDDESMLPPGEDPLDAELAAMEYGYDIYDYAALMRRLDNLPDTRPPDDPVLDDLPQMPPLNKCEIRVIRHAWDFDPADPATLAAVLGEYRRRDDVLDDTVRQTYLDGRQLYRNAFRERPADAE